MFRQLKYSFILGAVVLIWGTTSAAQSQESPAAKPIALPNATSGLGLDLFGGAGVSMHDLEDSFAALDLRANAIDLGGGVRLNGLWRGMFVQVSGAHWSDTGERVFVDDVDGTTFSLGIPLGVDATFIDATLGFKRALMNSRNPYFFYLGGGAGVIRYSESSPFAESGEALELSEPSYHVLAGVEIPIGWRLAAVVDGKYRYIPNLLGGGGVSAAVGEESFTGFNATVGLRLGLGGRPAVGKPPRAADPSKSGSGATATAGAGNAPTDSRPPTGRPSDGTILEAAPAYLIPDATRTPLSTLQAGTQVRVLQQKGDWVQIEFRDPRYGPRVGWVERRFVRLPG